MPAIKGSSTSAVEYSMLVLTVDTLRLAHYEVSLPALGTHKAVASVPSATNALADLPDFLAGRNSDDISDYLVAWNAREAGGDCLVTNNVVTGHVRKLFGRRVVDITGVRTWRTRRMRGL